MTWSVLKKAKFSQYSGETVTECWLENIKIVIIQIPTGSQ